MLISRFPGSNSTAHLQSFSSHGFDSPRYPYYWYTFTALEPRLRCEPRSEFLIVKTLKPMENQLVDSIYIYNIYIYIIYTLGVKDHCLNSFSGETIFGQQGLWPVPWVAFCCSNLLIRKAFTVLSKVCMC